MFFDNIGNNRCNNNGYAYNGCGQQSRGSGFLGGLLKVAAVATGVSLFSGMLFRPFGMFGGFGGFGGFGCGMFNPFMPMGGGAAMVNMFCSGSPFPPLFW